MLDTINQLNEIGWMTVITVLILIIGLTPQIIKTWKEFLSSLGLISKREVAETQERAEFQELSNRLNSYQKETFERETEWHQQSIDIRNNLDSKQDSLAITLDRVSAAIDAIRKELLDIRAELLDEKIERMRWRILDCANAITNKDDVSLEQLNYALKTYDDYEIIIEENHLTNNQVEESMKLIREKYQDKIHNRG